MTVRKRGRSWMADFMVSGNRYRETFDTEEEAQDFEDATRKAIKRGTKLPQAGSKRVGGGDSGTLGNVLRRAKAIHWGRKERSEKASINANIFVQWAGENRNPTDAFSHDTISEFVDHLIEEREVADTTINRYLSAISVMIKIAGLPKAELPWRKERSGRKRYFSEDEVAVVIRTLSLWGMHRERDFFAFLVDTGCRPYSEATRIRWDDIRDGKFVEIDATKDGNARTIPLTRRAREAVERQRSQAAGDGPFRDINQWHMIEVWRKLRAHIPALADTVLYTARHTCASWQVIRGVDVRRVQVWMGHKHISTTLIYAHLCPTHLLDNLKVLEGIEAPKLVAIEGGKVLEGA